MDKEELKRRRRALGYTQTELAKRLDRSLRSYQEWESGKTPISGIVELALQTIEREWEYEYRLRSKQRMLAQ